MYKVAFSFLIFLIAAGCSRSKPQSAETPRLLDRKEVIAYLAAEKALGLRGKTAEEVALLCRVTRTEMATRLKPFGLTPERFADLAREVFLARNARFLLVELGAERSRLCLELLRRPEIAGDKRLRDSLKAAASDGSDRSSIVYATILANAHTLSECENARGAEKP